MKTYTVAVPVYVTLTVKARTPEIAAEAARDYVTDNMLGLQPTEVGARQNGVLIETALFEGLDDDDTPDVFEFIRGKEVQVYPDPAVTVAAAA